MANSFLIDIDGTLLNNDKSINQSALFIQTLQRKNIEFLLATNSINPKSNQVQRLKNAGINIDIEQIFSPVDAINLYLKQHNIQQIYCVANEDRSAQLDGIQNSANPELIVLLDFEGINADYQILQQIVDFSERQIPIISASKSPYYLKNDKKQIDTGAFVHLLESITDKEIGIFGKPSPFYYELAFAQLNKNNKKVVVGDDITNDILPAKKLGIRSALVQSGKYKMGDEDISQPNWLIKDD